MTIVPVVPEAPAVPVWLQIAAACGAAATGLASIVAVLTFWQSQRDRTRAQHEGAVRQARLIFVWLNEFNEAGECRQSVRLRNDSTLSVTLVGVVAVDEESWESLQARTPPRSTQHVQDLDLQPRILQPAEEVSLPISAELGCPCNFAIVTIADAEGRQWQRRSRESGAGQTSQVEENLWELNPSLPQYSEFFQKWARRIPLLAWAHRQLLSWSASRAASSNHDRAPWHFRVLRGLWGYDPMGEEREVWLIPDGAPDWARYFSIGSCREARTRCQE